jgi:hypothetical protein
MLHDRINNPVLMLFLRRKFSQFVVSPHDDLPSIMIRWSFKNNFRCDWNMGISARRLTDNFIRGRATQRWGDGGKWISRTFD